MAGKPAREGARPFWSPGRPVWAVDPFSRTPHAQLNTARMALSVLPGAGPLRPVYVIPDTRLKLSGDTFLEDALERCPEGADRLEALVRDLPGKHRLDRPHFLTQKGDSSRAGAAELMKYVYSIRADLICLTRPRRSGLLNPIPSFFDGVLDRAKMPVLVIPEEAAPAGSVRGVVAHLEPYLESEARLLESLAWGARLDAPVLSLCRNGPLAQAARYWRDLAEERGARLRFHVCRGRRGWEGSLIRATELLGSALVVLFRESAPEMADQQGWRTLVHDLRCSILVIPPLRPRRKAGLVLVRD